MVHDKEISVQNISEWLNGLNNFNDTPEQGAGTTRLVFTPTEVKARNYIKSVMEAIGLKVEEDAIGNIFGILEGEEPELPPVWSGSHIDTVLHAGMFDGMAGVIAALEAVRYIKQKGKKTKRNICAIVFTSEEPTRFHYGYLGTRAMKGDLTLDKCRELKDDSGMTLYEQLEKLKYPLKEFEAVRKNKGDVHGMVELHIEQAEQLEKKNLKIGIVKSITGYTTRIYTVKGRQDHAGGTRMDMRSDAVCAAAELILKIEELAKSTKRMETVATVGKVIVYPNATNIISGDVRFSLDLRDDDMEAEKWILDKLDQYILEISKKRGVEVQCEIEFDDEPAKASEHIMTLIEESCMSHGLPYQYMRSGAGHDSLMVAAFAPFSMIFVPCHEGISHNPEEYAEMNDIADGTKVLADTLLKLANE